MDKALIYLAELKTGQWHNLNDIPKDLFDDAWKIIDEELLDGYRFTLHEIYSYLVMKIKRADKDLIETVLKEIKENADNINWLRCVFQENRYILKVGHTIVTKSFVYGTSDAIFAPYYGKDLLDNELLTFLYKHCNNIKIFYIKKGPKNV